MRKTELKIEGKTRPIVNGYGPGDPIYKVTIECDYKNNLPNYVEENYVFKRSGEIPNTKKKTISVFSTDPNLRNFVTADNFKIINTRLM